MPTSDATRWDSRYRAGTRNSTFEQPRSFLVENAGYLPNKGLALDAAMGLGGNAGFLIQRGWKVIGVDVSGVAVRQARQRLPGLMAVQADLTHFYLPSETFDAILNFFYLQRNLWPEYVRALRPGGVLVFETLTVEILEIHPETDPQYLLAPGELRQAFTRWPEMEITVYREGWEENEAGRRRAVASMVGRKKN